MSETTEGAYAMTIKIVSVIASEDQLLRRRLPRVIGCDNLQRAHNLYKAQGQVLGYLATVVCDFVFFTRLCLYIFGLLESNK